MPQLNYSLVDWFNQQRQQPPSYMRMSSWGAPAASGSPDVPSMNGADWEQMPMGTNGLGPNEGMFAGSAVNSPIQGIPNIGGAKPFGWVQDLRDGGILDSIDPQTGLKLSGAGSLALGAAQGLGSLYMGMQQYNLAKDSLAASKAQFERNFANQVKTTNTNLEDRQRARVASNSGAYESVDSYMNKNRVG